MIEQTEMIEVGEPIPSAAPPPGGDPIEKLYKAVVNRRLYSKSFDDFKRQYSSPDSIDKLYSVVSKNEMYSKSKDEFYKQYFSSFSTPKAEKVIKNAIQQPEGMEVIAGMKSYPAEEKPKQQVKEVDILEVEDPIKNMRGIALSRTIIPQATKSSTQVKKPIGYEEPQKEIITHKAAKEGIKEAEDYFRESPIRSINRLSAITGLNEDQLTSEHYDELVRSKLRPGNMTDKVAYEGLEKIKNVRKAIEGANSIEEIALNYAAIKDPRVAEQFKVLGSATQGLGNAKKGQLMVDFFTDPVVQHEIRRDPNLRQMFDEEKQNLVSHYPDAAKTYLGYTISQKMEDMGINNAILNVVTAKETDKAVEQLVKEGNMSPIEKAFYEKNMRGGGFKNFLKNIVGKGTYKTSGAIENILGGAGEGFGDLGKFIAEGTGMYEGALGEGKALSMDLERGAKRFDIKPKGMLHEITQFGGKLLGQSASIGAVGKGLQAARLIKNTSNAIKLSGAMQAYGNYRGQARLLFPNDELKQEGYATIMAAVEYFTENIFNDAKIVQAISKDVRPEVSKIIKQFTDKNIDAEQAKDLLTTSLTRSMERLPEASKYFSKAVGQNVAEELSADIIGQSVKGVFEGEKPRDWVDSEQVAQTLKQSFLGSGFIGALATRADLKNNKGITAKTVYDMARDADYWIEQMLDEVKLGRLTHDDAADKIENLQYAANVLNDLDRAEMKEGQKIKYLMGSLSQKVREKTASNTTDPTLKKKIEEGIKEDEDNKMRILEGEDDGTFEGDNSDMVSAMETSPSDRVKVVKEFFDLDLIPNQDLVMLVDKNGEFNSEISDEYLKFISQQAHGVDAEGYSLGASAENAMIDAGYPQQLIDYAKEQFPYEPKRNVSVIMPEENKSAEIIELQKPKEYAVSIKSTDEVDVQPKAGNGEGVGEGNIQPEEITGEKKEGEGKSEEKISGVPPISEPPKGKPIIHAERPPVELSYRGLQDIANEFSLPDVGVRDRKSDIQLRTDARNTVDEWAEKGVYAKNVEGLVEKAESGGVLTDEQRIILEGHLANVVSELENMNPKSKEFDTKFAEIKRLKDAGEKTRGEAGAALRIPTGRSTPRTIADALIEEQSISGVDILTDTQKETVIKEFEELKKANEELQQKVSALEAEQINAEAEKAINDIKKSPGSKKKSKGDYVKHRENLREQLKAARKEHEDWLKEQGIRTMGVGGFTVKEAKIVLEIVKSHIEEGIDTLADVVKRTLGDVKEIYPDMDEKDVHNIIAGEYSEKKPTRSEVAIKLQNLKTEASLLNEYERLLSGEEPKTEKGKIKRNRRFGELRDKIKELRGKTERASIEDIQRFKDRAKKKISELEERIATGDFEPKPKEKKELKLDEEGIKLKDRVIELENEKMYRHFKQIYERQTAWEKAMRYGSEIANVPRSIMASLDYSALLRQGIIPAFSRPGMAARTVPGMFTKGWNQKEFDRWFYDLRNSERFQLMKDSKLAITDATSPQLQAREEQYMSNLAEKIPGLGRAIKGSNRAYSFVLNKLRADMFNRFADALMERGVTFENNPEAYKQVAAYVNNATGRGDLGEFLNKIAPVLNALFFSPRLIAARMNMLTYMIQPRFYTKLPKEVRQAYFKDMAKFLSVGLLILGAAKMAGLDVEEDPRSTDFGKIRQGNTRWDIWGGFQQYVRLGAQMATAKRKTTTTGEIVDLGGKGPFAKDRTDVAKSFFRGKLAPVPAMGVDLLSGRTILGEKIVKGWSGDKSKKEVGMGEYALTHLLPLTATGMAEAFKDDGIRGMFLVGVPSTFGVGTQTFEPTPPKAKKTGKKNPKKSAKKNPKQSAKN